MNFPAVYEKKILLSVHMSPPLDLILSQLKQAHAFTE
jgi:hypothetical protein